MQAHVAAMKASLETTAPQRSPVPDNPNLSLYPSSKLARGAVALIGVAAMYASSYALLWRFNTQSGDVDGPTAPLVRQPTSLYKNDAIGQFNIKHNAEGTWPSVARLIRRHRVGALVVQEATAEDVSVLRERLPYMYHTTIKTDGNQRLLDGGSAQHVITVQRPSHIVTRSINGTGLLAGMVGMPTKGMSSLFEGESFAAGAADARQEMRAAVGITVPLGTGEARYEAQIFSSHLAGRGVDAALHNRQRPRLVDFVQDEQNSGERIVLIGDLNSGNNETADIARQLGHTVAATGPTHTDGKQTPDRVMYRSFQTGTARVIKTQGSDHNAVVFRFNNP